MTSSRFAELRQLFEQVCDLPAEEQRVALAQLSDDTALKAEVEALLGSETRGLRRASVPVAALLESMPETELDVGDRVGAWKLVQKLAVGGMGAVYLADRADGHFQQQAAVKLLRGFPSGEALTRLAAERQILASLQHPHIARLLDGGATPTGQPFLVLEYVEGVPIDQSCRERSLSLPARLRLFRNVCRAVAFAHQRLIVHCDLKPSNVLVRADGAPVLLDFGIARALEQSREGAPEAFYTPGYASPEQIAGAPLSVASDVYSLGLILFELLTGRRARLDAEDATVTRLGAAAVRPSDLADPKQCPWRRQLSGDLDAIVLHATADRPALRYASADALAEDVERYLDLRPVTARKQTLGYRYGKLLRRRWPLFAAGAAIVLLSALFTWRLVLARDRALAAEHDARQQAATAQQVSDFLVSVFQFANPEKNPDRREITAREVLDEGSKRIGGELAEQPRVRAQLSYVLGRAYWQLGRPNQAMELFDTAARLWQDSTVNEPLQAAQALSQLSVLQTNNHLPDAVATAQRMIELRSGRIPGDDPYMADSWNTFALALDGVSRFDEAEANYRKALDIRTARFGPRSLQVASTLHNMALLELHRNRPEAAAEIFAKTLEIKRELLKTDNHPDTLVSLENYARALSEAGRSEAAVELLRKALAARRELDGDSSANVSRDYNLLGSALHDAGKFREAAENYRQAMSIDAKVLGTDSPGYSMQLNNLASAFDDMGDYAAAVPLFRDSLAIRQKALGENDLMVARAQQNLARALIRSGDLEESKRLLDAALSTRERKLGAAGQETAKSQLLMVEWLRLHGDHEQAQSVLSAVDRSPSPFTPAMLAQRLGEHAHLLPPEQIGDAVALQQQARDVLAKALPPSHPFVAAATLELAGAAAAAGQVDLAKREYAAAVPVVEASFAKGSRPMRQLLALQATLGR